MPVPARAGLLVVALVSSLPHLARAAPALQVLSPGRVGAIRAPLQINVVLVGYEPGPGPREVDPAALLDGLPAFSAGVVAPPAADGLVRPAEVEWALDYRLTFVSAEFEDIFFAYLARVAAPAPLTAYQAAYNAEPVRSLDITGNAVIDAAAVERWLAEHAIPMLGIEPSQHTVFLLNWHGRPEFRFHVYLAPGDGAPGSRDERGRADVLKVIAWGGTADHDPRSGPWGPRRVWFHDLSAGPEFMTANWDLTRADVDGDGRLDYRMPPVWEYGNRAGYRPFIDLGGDLAKLVRYVATNLLFAPSPIHGPGLSPRRPSSVAVDLASTAGGRPAPHQPHVVALGGQHRGLAPPHEGIDVEDRILYFPSGPFFFARAGLESSTAMGALDVVNELSQFDEDSIARSTTVACLNHANEVLARIAASPRAARVEDEEVGADVRAFLALLRFGATDYRGAASHARAAHDGILAAAASLGVPIERDACPAGDARAPRAVSADPVSPLTGRDPPPSRAVIGLSLAPGRAAGAGVWEVSGSDVAWIGW